MLGLGTDETLWRRCECCGFFAHVPLRWNFLAPAICLPCKRLAAERERRRRLGRVGALLSWMKKVVLRS